MRLPLPLAIASENLPDGSVDLPFNTSVTVTGGSAVYNFVTSGDLPPGVVLTHGPSTIVLSGVPTREGEYRLNVNVVDVVNGTSANRTYDFRIGPRLVHPELAMVNISATETFHTSDSDNSFFPAYLMDGEVFHLTDSDRVFMPAFVSFAEGFTLKDTVNLFDAAALVDAEGFHLADSAVVSRADLVADPETFHLADTATVTAKLNRGVTIISPTLRTGTAAYITAYFDFTGATAPTGAVIMLVNGSSANISGLVCVNKTLHINCTATYSGVGVPVGNYTLTVSQAADSNYVAVSGTGFVTVTP